MIAEELNRTPAALAASELRTLVATKWYYYNDDGNVTRVVTAEGTVLGPPNVHAYSAVRMAYAKNQRTVAYAVGETWKWNGEPLAEPTNYVITYAYQYRYDGARERYLKRRLQTPTPWTGNGDGQVIVQSDVWTDYDGDEPYGDFAVSGSPAVATATRSFELGIGTIDPWVSSGGANTKYDHRDMIGTLRGSTNSTGAATVGPVYSAFGEQRTQLFQSPPRFGYAGAQGYQTDSTFPFLHVGHRYYDPASGRFLQRDPIGIDGEPNVYVYALNSPTAFIDDDGLSTNNPGGAAGNTPKGVKQVIEILDDMGKFAGDGAKSYEKYKQHKRKLEAYQQLCKSLKETLKKTKGKKNREKIEEAIDKWEKKAKGHEKEIKQKWPHTGGGG